jgi:hypothetical protein
MNRLITWAVGSALLVAAAGLMIANAQQSSAPAFIAGDRPVTARLSAIGAHDKDAGVVVAIVGFAHSAHAHGIAGNRFFPGTLAFDDPAVADESILPLFSSSKHPDEGGDVVDKRDLAGLFFVYSLLRLESASIADGFNAIGVSPDARASTRRTLR